jgi:hypothetical protein
MSAYRGSRLPNESPEYRGRAMSFSMRRRRSGEKPRAPPTRGEARYQRTLSSEVSSAPVEYSPRI